MRIVCPLFVCPLMRPFGAGGADWLGISVASAWTLAGEPLSAPELWKRFGSAAGGLVLDQALPKSASEWLLVGHAHASEPVTELVVGVEAFGSYKALNVVGDRVWRRGVPTEPEPFIRMPLDWTRAFGGAGYPDNPVGRGFTQGDPEGVALPNVELHGRMIDSPSARPQPAGYGPYGLDWPQRTRGLGTYDANWFERDFPGFARDIDWKVHNVAPPDQRTDAPIEPGQRFVLHNLVEGRPRVEVTLPRVVVRCFVFEEGAAESLEEVPLLWRTVWFVPDADMVVLLASGSRPSGSPLMSDVGGLLAGLDAADKLRDQGHWQSALGSRLGLSEDALLAAMDDAPLMPAGMTFPGFEAQAEDLTLPQRRGALAQNLHEGAKVRREKALQAFAEAGFEGGEELFPAPQPPPARRGVPSPDELRELRDQSEKQKAQAAERVQRLREEARGQLAAAGVDASFLDEKRSAGPPPVLAATRLEFLERAVRDGKAVGLPTEVFERQLHDPAFHRQLIEQERQGREGYRLIAHREEALPAEPSLDARMTIREQVQAAIRDRTSLSEVDLTCADLNELDLSGMDLRGAWLEGAELSGANLTGASLERAVLAKADLTDAVLESTVLRYANLGRSRLLFTKLTSCDLRQAILAHANLRAAAFVGCDMHGADLSEARFEKTQFSDCNLASVTLLKMSLTGTEFRSCSLAEANLVDIELDGVSFHRCDLSKAALVTCRGEGVRFDEAKLENLRLVAGCVFDGADFRGADLSRATLRGSSLRGAHFEESSLVNADLSTADCAGAHFERADMKRLLATECGLAGAVLRGANLMEAVLQGADLRGTDLSHANLFGADLALVRGDDHTKLDKSLATRMRVRPLRKADSLKGRAS